MKKFTLVLGLSALAMAQGAWAEKYVTSGDGSTYNFERLLKEGMPGLYYSEGQYLLDDTLHISKGDVLADASGLRLLMGDGACISVDGSIVLSNGAKLSSIEDEGAHVSILVNEGGNALLDGVELSGVALLSIDGEKVTVRNSAFVGVTAEAASLGAISFIGESKGNVISGCYFANCGIPAIGTAANCYAGIVIEGCEIEDCNTDNSNKPMLNLTTPGENGPLLIKGCTITGAKRNMVGGISVANLVGAAAGDVVIEGNEIRDCRYGINLMGPLNARIADNVLVDNRYEDNPMNGGSAISVTGFADGLDVVMSGNHIEGSLWGVTVISYGLLYPSYYKGFKNVTLGEAGNLDSPGGNVFVANGNDGKGYDPSHPYDLYNNSDQTVYAQCNTWSVAEQSAEAIASVIFDHADDPKLGEVVYMPASGIEDAMGDAACAYDAAGKTLLNGTCRTVAVYAADGRMVLKSSAERISLAHLPAGVYVAGGIKVCLR